MIDRSDGSRIARLAKSAAAAMATVDPATRPRRPSYPLPQMRPYLLTSFEDISLVWVCTQKLDQMWSINSEYYIPVWNGEPPDHWFTHSNPQDDRYGIRVPEIALELVGGQESISFANGRHRTRWLIQNGFKEIAVGMPAGGVARARQLGLVTRTFVDGEKIVL